MFPLLRINAAWKTAAVEESQFGEHGHCVDRRVGR